MAGALFRAITVEINTTWLQTWAGVCVRNQCPGLGAIVLCVPNLSSLIRDRMVSAFIGRVQVTFLFLQVCELFRKCNCFPDFSLGTAIFRMHVYM